MFDSIREAVGAEPVLNDDGTYSPSPSAIKVAVPQRTDYTEVDYPNAVTGDRMRVLLICTDESRLTCEGGRVFRTGNHPTEIFTVVRHLERAGFAVDFATPSGAAVPLEEFAVPHQDSLTTAEIADHRDQLENPLGLDVVYAALTDTTPYAAVYLPGGHGALLSVPFSAAAGRVLNWFIEHDRFVITICHGPAGLLSLADARITHDHGFPLAGYSMTLFPAAADQLMALSGYLPGAPTWNFQHRLEDLGIKVLSHLPTGSTHRDRKLLSGDSPFAADKLGQLASRTLLAELHSN